MKETLSTGLPPTVSSPRHICLVTETYPPEINGVAFTLARLANGLRARGHEVSLVRPRQRMFDRCDGYDSHAILARGLPLPGYRGTQFGLPANRLLRRSWMRHRPDAVYVATEGPLGWSALRTARRLAIPVFSGFHTNFHSYSRYYRMGWLRQAILGYLREFHNRTEGTLVPSVELRDRLLTLGFHNVAVLGRGVDSDLFTPERRCLALRRQWGAATEEDLVALYVGRVAPEKNMGLAVAAYRAMQQCNDSVKFVVVGDGPSSAALQKDHPDLICCGVRTGEQLATYYASADVFLFPSETETFGNVTLEALASGLIVVAYDYAAAKMHISHGETGMLAPYGDAGTFVELAVALAREPHTRHAIRRQARKQITTIDWRHIVERFAMLTTGTPAENRLAPEAPVSYRGAAA